MNLPEAKNREEVVASIYSDLREKGFSDDKIDFIMRSIAFDKAKEVVNRVITNKSFDVEDALDKFLKQLKNRETRLRYENAIRPFLKMHPYPADVTNRIADQYIRSLEEERGFSANYTLLCKAALSSFFKTLVRWEYIHHNPFAGGYAPAKVRQRELHVPTEDEIDKIYESILFNEKLANRYHVYFGLKMMVELGLRVGAIKTLQVLDGGLFVGRSKGNEVSGTFPSSLKFDMLKKGYDFTQRYPFSTLTGPFLQARITKHTKALYEEGKIKHPYSPHAFRHYFAIKTYKDKKDIYEVSRRLNHRSVRVTQVYLAGLPLRWISEPDQEVLDR